LPDKPEGCLDRRMVAAQLGYFLIVTFDVVETAAQFIDDLAAIALLVELEEAEASFECSLGAVIPRCASSAA